MFIESTVFEALGIGTITLSNPPVNALSKAVFDELDKAFDQMLKDENVCAIVITGSGKFFSAGADIRMLYGFVQSGDANGTRKEVERLHEIVLRIDGSPKPVVAAVNGVCLGGGLELALACDYIIAAADVQFGFPEVTIGIIPGLGGTQRFPRRVGKINAARYILAGRKFDEIESETIGLIDCRIEGEWGLGVKAFCREALEGKRSPKPQPPGLSGIQLYAMASGIGNPAFAVEEAYLAIHQGTAMPNLRQALEMETDHFIACMLSRDGQEGLAAFVEKRKPHFSRVISS